MAEAKVELNLLEKIATVLQVGPRDGMTKLEIVQALHKRFKMEMTEDALTPKLMELNGGNHAFMAMVGPPANRTQKWRRYR